MSKSIPFGELLISRGLLTPDQLRIALLEQSRQNKRLGETLVSLGFINNSMMREALADNLAHQSIDLNRVTPDPSVLALIPKDFAAKHQIFPVAYKRDENRLIIAMANPNNLFVLDQVRFLLGHSTTCEALLAPEGEIRSAIEKSYGHELSIDGILEELDNYEIKNTNLNVGSDEYEQPMARLINSLLSDGVYRRASDIHLEPEESFVRIRYRTDGVLRQVRIIHKKYWAAMVVRLKVISGMNIAESRAPQDGHISLDIFGRPIDFRVAAQPTIHGENFVLRILDRQRSIVPLDKLDLTTDALYNINLMLARPEGIFLITGPTGSGKTTTLYSILSSVNTERVNIMTLEDPVEYPVGLMRQSSLSDGLKMDFASGIRSILRQDPDIILVGEIRDKETAQMAFRAAMTGHQVFSTLHTNSAIGAVARLLDIGILPDIIASNVIGVLAQRLLRKLCPHCKAKKQVTTLEKKLLGLEETAEELLIYEEKGCELCDYVGFKGRLSILEQLRFTPEIEESVASNVSAQQLMRVARSQNFKTLADDAIRLVKAGATSLNEISRVVNLTGNL
ncbi:MAG: GspE/PulE family protein [Burkholderiaceae bacterium]|jgi:type II secretory ATPase GspE/PulE/Tfp pilus assembly ATPase PilB-like protein